MTLALGITAPLVSVTVPEIEPLENWPNKDELKKRAARSRPKMRLTTLAWRFPFTWGSCSVVNLYMDPLAPFPASQSTCQLGTPADKSGTGRLNEVATHQYFKAQGFVADAPRPEPNS